MDEAAAIGGIGIGIDGIEGIEAQDAPGIDRIGIADPGLDLRHREALRARRHRRARGRRARGQDRAWLVEFGLPAEPDAGMERLGLDPDQAQQAVESQQPARGHRGRALDSERPGQHELRRRAPGLGEIMGRLADAALRGRQAEAAAHRPAEPGIDRHLLRPAAFIEPAQDDEIGRLQPGLQRAPDGKAGMAAVARPQHAPGQQALQQGRPAPSLDGRDVA